jgi:hypothetical protein
MLLSNISPFHVIDVDPNPRKAIILPTKFDIYDIRGIVLKAIEECGVAGITFDLSASP